MQRKSRERLRVGWLQSLTEYLLGTTFLRKGYHLSKRKELVIKYLGEVPGTRRKPAWWDRVDEGGSGRR